MPRYDWKCSCGAVTEVFRRMDDSGVGPHGSCKRCGGTLFARQFTPPQVHVPGGRSENSVWPVTIKRAEAFYMKGDDGQIVCDPSGQPIRNYKDKTFANKKELDSYLESQGKVLMMDGEADSTFSETSQHSVFNNDDTPPPTERAGQFAEAAFFVEEREDGNFYDGDHKLELAS